MNIASLENCKRLYELTDWKADRWWHKGSDVNGGDYVSHYDGDKHTKALVICPAYNLGFLVRMLKWASLALENEDLDGNLYWVAVWHLKDENGEYPSAEANTPEDAYCKLAIQLIEQHIIEGEKQ